MKAEGARSAEYARGYASIQREFGRDGVARFIETQADALEAQAAEIERLREVAFRAEALVGAEDCFAEAEEAKANGDSPSLEEWAAVSQQARYAMDQLRAVLAGDTGETEGDG